MLENSKDLLKIMNLIFIQIFKSPTLKNFLIMTNFQTFALSLPRIKLLVTAVTRSGKPKFNLIYANKFNWKNVFKDNENMASQIHHRFLGKLSAIVSVDIRGEARNIFGFMLIPKGILIEFHGIA